MIARVGLALLVAAACFVGGRALLAEQLARAEPERLALAPLPTEGRRALTLTHSEGRVLQGTPARGFVPAERGQPLAEGESLRIGGGARATLRLGVASAIALEPGSEVTALPAPPGEVALRLDGGRARVTLEHPDRVLRLTAPDGGEARALGGPGTRFLVAVHPGRFALLHEGGDTPVRMIAGGAEVEVPPSRVSWSVHGGPPRPPIEPPSEPGLEIAAVAHAPPEGGSEDEPEHAAADAGVLVSGRVHPLALVRVGATVVDVRADGSFEARMPRADAPYAVLASLPTGREALLEVAAPPVVEAPPPAALERGAVVEQPAKQPREKPRKKRGTRKKRRGSARR